ncbi:cupin domain-containing protein [Prescottella equi]|uniref:cupin domain-containing protein n=1 Tax=Rhodococcus hoagii TaxID=43767 RepID=UPI000A10DFD9|nr:cupin domain-containing protein [Prescottella equi]NKS34135.1 cupin domain-containing protein [Prescottella equi]NKZ75645.1 cupin domain-containing protein [Prescottella equi]
MPIRRSGDHDTHELHGAQFHSYVAPSRGSRQLCAWRTDLVPGSAGAAHTVSHEEVLLVLDGTPVITLDDSRFELSVGDVVFVPESATVQLDNPSGSVASLWVTTSVGMTAITADRGTISPPWAC